jgi:5-methylcytosine-specific restriction endonuclease McrA
MKDRRYLSQRDREAECEAQKWLCACCGKPLIPGQIEADHIQALEHDGDNASDNWQMLCRACHKDKTRRDHQARAKRDRIIVGGRQRKSPPMPGSRQSKFKRLMSGQTILR